MSAGSDRYFFEFPTCNRHFQLYRLAIKTLAHILPIVPHINLQVEKYLKYDLLELSRF